MTYEEEQYQKLCLSIVQISDYCRRHECNLQCDFFTGRDCLIGNRRPEQFKVPVKVYEKMNTEILNKVENN